jgi:glycine betaine/proline transport system substrate-binding protein
MFGKYDLRYLKDPKGTLGSYERIHAIARQGFYQENPDVALMISRMYLPIDMLQSAMFDAQDTTYEKAVDEFIKSHPKMVDYWVTGQMQ